MGKIRFSFSIILHLCVICCFGESVTIVKNSATEYISSHFEGTSRYWVTELKIVGEMNGKDVHFIKEIATSENNGNLTTLDLSEASFVDVDGLEEVFEDKELNKTYSSSSIYNGLRYGYHDVYKKYLGNDQYDTYYFGYHIVWKDEYPGFSQFKLITVEKIDINSICGHFLEDCDKLTSVILPPNTTGIGKYAFSGCTNLNILNITDGIEFVGDYAFANCVKKQDIKLPTGLKSIGNNAFDGCISLSSIVIPDNVKSLGSYIFSGCTELKTAKLSDNIETVPFGLFYKCKNLKSVNIPKNSVEIKTYAFCECGMDSIFLYDKLNRIGTNVFDGCPLKCVYITAEMPPSCGTNPFFQSGKGRTLYVPLGCVERYCLSPAWKEFEFIIEMSELNNKKCEKPTISYKNNKLFFYSNTEDVSFVSTISDTDIKMYNSNLIELSATYNITVYAKKNGYEDSEITTATLCWIDVDPKTEGLSNDVAQVRANAVLIQSMDGQIAISGIDDGTRVSAYNVNGQQVGSTISHNGLANLTTNLRPGSIVIIKIGDRSVKATIK